MRLVLSLFGKSARHVDRNSVQQPHPRSRRQLGRGRDTDGNAILQSQSHGRFHFVTREGVLAQHAGSLLGVENVAGLYRAFRSDTLPTVLL